MWMKERVGDECIKLGNGLYFEGAPPYIIIEDIFGGGNSQVSRKESKRYIRCVTEKEAFLHLSGHLTQWKM